jgi:hypothetical protein
MGRLPFSSKISAALDALRRSVAEEKRISAQIGTGTI